MIEAIDSWGDQLSSWDTDTLTDHLSSLWNTPFISEEEALWSTHPFIAPLIETHNQYGREASNAFFNLVVHNSVPNQLGNKDTLMGLLAGYEFLVQDPDRVKRRKGEKVSLGHLRKQMSAARDQCFFEVGKLYRVHKKLGKRQRTQQKNQFNSDLQDWHQKMDDLENLYNEKLRLSKPAEYWSKAAKKYDTQGKRWSWLLVGLVAVGVGLFAYFFIQWLQGQEIGIELDTIQGAIIFGTIVALFAFILRVVSRLVFSSFHLMRDAQEREQLTYLYLSLANETEVDEKSREIVLQALFSRSQTGLISQDHGPTMPIVEAGREIMKK